MLQCDQVQAEYDQLIREENREKLEAVAALEAEAKEHAAFAAREVARLRGEADDTIAEILRAGEEEARQLEAQRLHQLEEHNATMLQLEEQLLRRQNYYCGSHSAQPGEREATDERLREIDLEVQALHAETEAHIRTSYEERAETTRAVREHAEAMSAQADERYRLALENDRNAKADARKVITRAEQDRSLSVREAEHACQIWLGAFNGALEETQQSLAARLDELLREARKSREHLEDCRNRVDAHWQLELADIRQDARKERLEAAKSLESARIQSRGTRRAGQEILDAGVQECLAMRQRHLNDLRDVAKELDEVRRGLGISARDDPQLVQSLKDLATTFRTGKVVKTPPKASPWEMRDDSFAS
eukprot:TRINITY_DN21620_c0_g1_i1.p1 TRINITY_DN21620_c0_g1~~TRINITY_DN21620_c0_g1_i1.p1  ORF type:complete len:364 (+),score=89.57 TRINITY_DN21620_c0_g1_i1:61-1152(+)